MAADYLTCPIADLLESGALAINDGYRAKNSELADHGIPFARAGNIDGGFHFDDADRVPDETLSRVGVKVSEPGDVVFTSKGTVGRFAFVRDGTPRFVYSPQLCFWRVLDPTRISPNWLYYWMNSREFFLQFKGVAGQTDMAEYVSLRDQRAMRITLPPLAEQKRIAHILGTLDDKIELNRRMNATREGISRAIFKSWFVDFDPVRQKAAGKQPLGMDAQTAALFPDSLEDSEIGEVPKGWRVDSFIDHFDVDRGLSYKGEGLREDGSGVPMHNLNSIYEGGGSKHEGIKFYAGEYRDKHVLTNGDVIVTNTEQGFDHLLIGHAAIVPACFGATGLYSHHIYRVRCKPSSPLTPQYVVSLFNNPRWHYWISGFSNGTTINMLPLDALQMPLLVVPPPRLVEAFDQLAKAAYLRCEANREESSRLAALRDTLLPKLLSGEVRVPEAAEADEEAIR
jgi:type I restriction enzyme, S subunit